jgi:glutamate:GABA antiporter
MTAQSVAPPPRLKFLDTVLYAIVMNIGMRWLAVAAAVGPASLPLWVVSLVVFFLPLAVATAELTARVTGEGGIYAWTREAFGPLAGFLCGWFYWFSLMPFFAGVLYFLAGLAAAAVGAGTKSGPLYLSITLALSCFVIGVQLVGFHFGKWLTNLGAAGNWLIFLVLVAVAGLLISHGASATNFARASYALPMNFDTAILWGTIVFAVSGVESLGFLRNDIEGGMNTILKALAIVGVLMVLIYLAGTVAMLVILPQHELTRLAGFPDAVKSGLQRVGFAAVTPWVIAAFALASLGSVIAWFGAGARLPFAAGIDNFLPPVFARRNPKTGAPTAALLLQGGLMLAFVILGQAGEGAEGTYDFLVVMSVLTVTIPYAMLFAAHLKFARAVPVPGAWRPPGGARTSIALGAAGLVSTLVAIACTVVPSSSDPHPLATFVKIMAATGIMVAVGLALYWAGRRKVGA